MLITFYKYTLNRGQNRGQIELFHVVFQQIFSVANWQRKLRKNGVAAIN